MVKHDKETKQCTLCLVDKPLNDFYVKKSRGKAHTYCKVCLNAKTIERQRKIKQDAVEYKGGSCERCGYDNYIGALHFHHLDPNIKDVSWKTFKLRKFNDAFKAELDKCILLCANCHAEMHAKD